MKPFFCPVTNLCIQTKPFEQVGDHPRVTFVNVENVGWSVTWNPIKVNSWCGADMEMQGDSTSDQYVCLQPTSVLHRAVLHIRYWADMRMSTKCRLLISDRGKKPMSVRCGNARRLDIGPIWLFNMQPTSARHSAVLHIRYRADMITDTKCLLGMR